MHSHEHGHDHEHHGHRRGGRGPFRGGGGPFGGGPFGGGPFGAFFGGGGPWGKRGRGPGGRARRGDVRASILALLKERPMHGYEIIQEIGERSGGAWRPSPGSVYPTLQLLEEEELITSQSEGGKKQFSLTDAGRAEAEAGTDEPWAGANRGPDWEALSELRDIGLGLMEALGQVWRTGSPEQREKAVEILKDTRKKLYLILADED